MLDTYNNGYIILRTMFTMLFAVILAQQAPTVRSLPCSCHECGKAPNGSAQSAVDPETKEC